MACGHCGPSCTHEHREEHPVVPERGPAGAADLAPSGCCAGSDRPAPDRVERVPEERVEPGRTG